MDEKVINNIKEQIEFLKLDLLHEIPLNMDSEFQPQAVIKIVEARESTKRQIITLMNRLAGIEQVAEPANDDRLRYHQMLERIATDQAALDAAKEAVCEMDDDDVKQQTIENAVTQYEETKRDIAAKLLEKLG